MRLLVLDDERGIATLIATVARDRGWTVDTAVTVREFRAQFAAHCPDAITLDLQLGTGDGIEELRFLREAQYRGAIVLMSGFDARVLASARQRGETLGLSIVATATKPLRLAALRGLLAQLEQTAPPEAAAAGRATPPRVADPGSGIDPDAVAAGLAAGEMALYLQPVVSAVERKIQRFEALIRWHHPRHGLVPPDRFIPVAEREPAVADRLTLWVVETALRLQGDLAARGYPVPISVNVSGVNLHTLDFPDRIAALAADAGTDPRMLGIEITESVAMRDPGTINDILTRLRLKGFSLAMDDFGTGYSSLQALSAMPFSEIKIDKSFVDQMQRSEPTLTIVKSAIALADNLGLDCIAEGVETAATADQLTDLGVTGLQGYYFSRPVPFADAIAWLENGRSAAPAAARVGDGAAS